MPKGKMEDLSKEELLKVIEMFSQNWLTVDGLWFTMVEEKYGLDAAMDFDLQMWKKQSLIEARRIKKIMGIEGGGVKGVLNALRFMSFDPAMPFEYALDGPKAAYMWVPSCRPQAARVKAGRGAFPCRAVGLACYEGLAQIIDPAVKVELVFCPPEGHQPDAWCKWRLSES